MSADPPVADSIADPTAPPIPFAWPGHFLTKRCKELLAQYTALEHRRCPYEYTLMFSRLLEYNAKAFHTKDTLALRRFYHCPTSEIPHYSCVKVARTTYDYKRNHPPQKA